MTRESRARWLAFATTALVVLLAALFAELRNLHPVQVPAVAQTPATAAAATADGMAAGRDGVHAAAGRRAGEAAPSGSAGH